MILVLILGLLFTSTAEELPEETQPQEAQPPQCNCTHLLQSEDVTDISPTFPTTSFTCWGRYDGYYADIEVDCTIFHYCQTWHFPTGLNETVKWDFACPQSTIFNQKVLSCTPPNISFDCQESPNYYWVNYNLTSSTTTPEPTTEFSTPVPQFGQQLIVGGIGAQSATFPDSPEASTDSDSQSTTFEDSAVSADSSTVLAPASLDTEESIAFPDSDHSGTDSVPSSDPPQAVVFPDATHSDMEPSASFPAATDFDQSASSPAATHSDFERSASFPSANSDFEQPASFSDASLISTESAQPTTFSEFFHNQHHQPVATNSPDFGESGSGSDQPPGEVVSAGNDSETINFPN